jgi:hypothetical protein
LFDGIPLEFDRTPLHGLVFGVSLFLHVEKGIRMVERIDPRGIANFWGQAAEKVATLRRTGTGDVAAAWNEAIDQAEALLHKEAEDVLFMARMAHLLIVGNIVNSR